MAGLFTVASFGGFERSTPFECVLQECSLQLVERDRPGSLPVGSWTSLHRKRDPRLTSHVAARAPLFGSKRNRREAIAAGQAGGAFTREARPAACAPRKGYVAHEPRRLQSCSHFEVLPSKPVGPFVFESEYADQRNTLLHSFHPHPRQRSVGFHRARRRPSQEDAKMHANRPLPPYTNLTFLHPCSQFRIVPQAGDRAFTRVPTRSDSGTWRFTTPTPASAADAESARVLFLTARRSGLPLTSPSFRWVILCYRKRPRMSSTETKIGDRRTS